MVDFDVGFDEFGGLILQIVQFGVSCWCCQIGVVECCLNCGWVEVEVIGEFYFVKVYGIELCQSFDGVFSYCGMCCVELDVYVIQFCGVVGVCVKSCQIQENCFMFCLLYYFFFRVCQMF